MLSVIFRCDAGHVKRVGTGHLFRSITIANLLIKKFNIPRKKIIFITKTKNKFSLAKNILNKNNFTILPIKENAKNSDEYSILKKLKSTLLIIDKYRTKNTKYLDKIKKNFKKIILLDAIKYENNYALYINSLIHEVDKSIKHKGFKYLICPSFLLKKNKPVINKEIKKIFLFFGGFDNKNIMQKIIKYFVINKSKYILYIPLSLKKEYSNNKKIRYYNNKNIYNFLSSSDLAITSGGLIMFDVINIKKPLITIPQYLHQKKNIKKLVKKNCLKNLNFNKYLYENLSKYLLLINNFYQRNRMIKNQNKILSGNKTPKAIELIYNEYKK